MPSIVIRLVGVLSPDLLKPVLGDKVADLGEETDLVEEGDLVGEDLFSENAGLGDKEADFAGEVGDFSGDAFFCDVAGSVLWILFFSCDPAQEDSSHGSNDSSACEPVTMVADLRLYLIPSSSLTGDTNISFIGLVYSKLEFRGLSIQEGGILITSDDTFGLLDTTSDSRVFFKDVSSLL